MQFGVRPRRHVRLRPGTAGRRATAEAPPTPAPEPGPGRSAVVAANWQELTTARQPYRPAFGGAYCSDRVLSSLWILLSGAQHFLQRPTGAMDAPFDCPDRLAQHCCRFGIRV